MTVEVITTTGAGSWTVPTGVTSVQVECWGGGDGIRGVSGGGGAYSRSTLTVTAGSVITYQVGQGTRTDSNTYQYDPQDTWFQSSTSVMAKTASGSTGGQAAQGYGTVKYSGGNGASGSAGGGGGAASPFGNGANGAVATFNPNMAGNGGSSPNAGAGGAGATGFNQNEQPGASNIEGGGGGGGSFFVSPDNRGLGGLPGGGRGGKAGNPGSPFVEAGARGQIRLTYDGGGGGTPAPTPAIRKRRLSSLL